MAGALDALRQNSTSLQTATRENARERFLEVVPGSVGGW